MILVLPSDLLTLFDSDPAAGILAAADLREQRANAATPGPYTASRYERTGDRPTGGEIFTPDAERKPVPYTWLFADAEHIAAEANPAHALAAVRRWRGVVERHVQMRGTDSKRCDNCGWHWSWPCPDLIETADEARAYLGVTP